MNEFEERKQKKERGLSVKDTINQSLEKTKDIESIVIVSKNKDGTVETSFNWKSSLEALGMLDVGKADILSYLES